MTTQVGSSSVSAYRGLRLGYRVELQQEGNRVRGSGYKVTENGRPLGGGGRTAIAVEGTVDGDRLTLSFSERGLRRRSGGSFVLQREDTDTLRGRFSSDAAQSSGTVEAQRR